MIPSIIILSFGYEYDDETSELLAGRTFTKENSSIGVDSKGIVRIHKRMRDGFYSRVFEGHVKNRAELEKILWENNLL